MNKLKLKFPIAPVAIQSTRFFRRGNHVGAYQTERNVTYKQNLKTLAIGQLDDDFVLFDQAIRIDVEFVFLVPKYTAKKIQDRIASGEIIYKDKRPDLVDNLMKGTIDALTGVVWRDDSLICEVSSRKRFGKKAGISITVTTL